MSQSIPTLSLAIVAGHLLITPALAAVTTTDTFGSGGNAFTMDFVTVGNPGNTPDTGPRGLGSVATTYRIGRYEVSEDMITKANAAGGLSITKDTRGTNKPATSISWFEAARFVNYLNVTSGSTPAYKFSAQPGNVAYTANATILLWAPGDAGYDITNPFRNSNAKYFLPNENEWYKAAYYSSMGTYFDYPIGSDTIPTAVAGGTLGGTAVYGLGYDAEPADVTSAGYPSPYGTMGQGGNAREWTETSLGGVNDDPDNVRAVRGGTWEGEATNLQASVTSNSEPLSEGYSTGFRVASVPEPTSILLTMLAGGVMVIRRKR